MNVLSSPPGRPVGAIARIRTGAFVAGMALSLALSPWALAQTPAMPGVGLVQLPTLAPLVKKVLPAVVNVSVSMKADAVSDEGSGDGDEQQFSPGQPGMGSSPFDEFLRRFFDQQQGGHGRPMPRLGERTALGSGFIIDPSGYIVTNNHVVQNANKVTVIFQDDSKHTAKVIGRDAKTDLALLKINAPEPLPYVQWGDSNVAQVGDWVLAVGNPFGLGGTVSSGIISARGRDIHAGPYDDFLQIDASINRGNSGGPTFSLDGKVIGINTAIYSPNGGSVGIGFAIPASLAKPVIEQIREHGKVERGWLGVQIQAVTPDIAKNLGLPKDEGALVADVTHDSPAAKIGVKQGDVILSYDGHDITRMRDLPVLVAETAIGGKADLKVWREGKEVTLQPVIAAMPDNLQVANNEGSENEATPTPSTSAMGLKLSPLTPELRRQLHVPASVKGVVVSDVADDSPLAQLGITAGDVIQTINQEPVTSPKEVSSKLAAARKGGKFNLLLLINRHGINQYVALSVNGDGNG